MSNKVVAIGIDPGKSGAMAVVSDVKAQWDGGPESSVCVIPFDKANYAFAVKVAWGCQLLPNLKRGINGREICEFDPTVKIVCVVEHVGAMPGQGSVSTFHFGENFGWIQGVLDSWGIPYELVRPQKWKREFSCTSDKNTSIAVARRLFPDVDLRRTERCAGPHDGICEALLMAEYARRVLA